MVDKNKWPWATRSKNIDRNIEWCYVQDDVLTRTSIEKWKMVPVDELKRLLEDTKFASKLDVLGPEKVKAIRDIMQGNEPEIGEIADMGAEDIRTMLINMARSSDDAIRIKALELLGKAEAMWNKKEEGDRVVNIMVNTGVVRGESHD